MLANKVVVELGAGCGLPAITMALYCEASTVHLTDIHSPALSNAHFNLLQNAFLPLTHSHEKKVGEEEKEGISSSYQSPLKANTTIQASRVNWADESSYPTAAAADILLGSDLVYDAAALELFVTAVDGMLKPGGYLLYVAPNTGRDGMDSLITQLAARHIICDTCLPCPTE